MPASPRIPGGEGSRQTPTDGSRRDHGIKAKETWNLHGLCCFFLVELHQLYINCISKMASVVGKMMKNLRPNLLDFPMDPPWANLAELHIDASDVFVGEIVGPGV